MLIHRKDLKPICLDGGTVWRTLVTIGTEPIVLLHKSHPMLMPKFNRAQWSQFIGRADADERTHAIVKTWNRYSRFSFNCHTFSIASFLGVGPHCWVEGSGSVFTLLENPAQDLLDAFFVELDAGESVSELSTEFQDDDVIVFAQQETTDLVHSGRIRIVNGNPVVMSKLGEHPVAIAHTDDVAAQYQGHYDIVKLYRYRGDRVADHSR